MALYGAGKEACWVYEYWPEGSTFFPWPHYIVAFEDGGEKHRVHADLLEPYNPYRENPRTT